MRLSKPNLLLRFCAVRHQVHEWNNCWDYDPQGTGVVRDCDPYVRVLLMLGQPESGAGRGCADAAGASGGAGRSQPPSVRSPEWHFIPDRRRAHVYVTSRQGHPPRAPLRCFAGSLRSCGGVALGCREQDRVETIIFGVTEACVQAGAWLHVSDFNVSDLDLPAFDYAPVPLRRRPLLSRACRNLSGSSWSRRL